MNTVTGQPRRFKDELARGPHSACICGARLGKHRYADDACPNPAWKPGNGQPQWLTTKYLWASRR